MADGERTAMTVGVRERADRKLLREQEIISRFSQFGSQDPAQRRSRLHQTTSYIVTLLQLYLQLYLQHCSNYLPTSVHSSTPQGTPKHSVCPLKMLRGPTSPQFLLSQIHRSLGGHFVIELSGVTAAHRRRKFESGNCVRDRSLNFSPSSVSPSTLHAFARTLRASTMIPS